MSPFPLDVTAFEDSVMPVTHHAFDSRIGTVTHWGIATRGSKNVVGRFIQLPDGTSYFSDEHVVLREMELELMIAADHRDSRDRSIKRNVRECRGSLIETLQMVPSSLVMQLAERISLAPNPPKLEAVPNPKIRAARQSALVEMAEDPQVQAGRRTRSLEELKFTMGS